MTRTPFGTLPDGARVDLFTFTNAAGLELRVITYGCVIVSLRAPDRDGRFADIVLGFDALEPYIYKSRYFGAVVGRYANRIAAGRFTMDGKEYALPVNRPPNHLHGGVKGFDKVVWHADPVHDPRGSGVVFSRRSPDGEEGYPGTLDVRVTYVLTDRNELSIDYEAETDAPTPVNLSQHSYFNLGGEGSGDILDHRVTINGSAFTPVSEALIPTGEIAPVAGTPFDFRQETSIGARIDADHEQLRLAGGYDHNYVLDRADDSLVSAAHVFDPASGRTLDVATTEPGMQFYSGNFLDGSATGKSGVPYTRRSGLCLETQHFPDSPNHPNFPSTILRPGQLFRSRTVYTFGRQG